MDSVVVKKLIKTRSFTTNSISDFLNAYYVVKLCITDFFIVNGFVNVIRQGDAKKTILGGFRTCFA